MCIPKLEWYVGIINCFIWYWYDYDEEDIADDDDDNDADYYDY